MNIVIIDDDIFVSGALKTILEASGDITVSATGRVLPVFISVFFLRRKRKRW